MGEVATELAAAIGSDATLSVPDNWRMRHIAPHEGDRLSAPAAVQSEALQEDIRSQLAATSFNQSLSVRISGGTAIGSRKSRIIAKLYPEKPLLDERHALIDALPWQPGFRPAPDDEFFFQVAIGKLHNRVRKVELMHLLTDVLPKTIILKPGLFAVYERTD